MTGSGSLGYYSPLYRLPLPEPFGNPFSVLQTNKQTKSFVRLLSDSLVKTVYPNEKHLN